MRDSDEEEEEVMMGAAESKADSAQSAQPVNDQGKTPQLEDLLEFRFTSIAPALPHADARARQGEGSQLSSPSAASPALNPSAPPPTVRGYVGGSTDTGNKPDEDCR